MPRVLYVHGLRVRKRTYTSKCRFSWKNPNKHFILSVYCCAIVVRTFACQSIYCCVEKKSEHRVVALCRTAFRTDRCTNEVGIRDRIESVWRSRRTKKIKKTFTSLWWPIALNNDVLLKKFRGFAFLNPVGFSNLAGFWRSYSNIIFKANLHTAKTTK